MASEPQTARGRNTRVANHLKTYPILYAGLLVLLAMEAVALLLRLHYYGSVTLPSSWGPDPPHIVVMRLVGTLTGILFLIYGQWLYSRLHRTQNKLSHTEQLYRRIIETSPDGIVLSAPDAHIVMANQKAAECLGYDDVEDLIGKNPLSLVSPSERERAEAGIEALLAGGLPKKTEYLVLQKDGRAVPLEVTSYKATDVDGLATAVISVLRDVSDRRQLERRVLEACEGEQRRIGRELHDSICSELAGMGFMAEAARKSFEGESDRAAQQFGEMAVLMRDAVAKARMLSQGLCITSVGPGNLRGALATMVAQSEKRYGITCRFTCSDSISIHDDALESHLYQIAHEAVQNAMRHAHAIQVSVDLTEAGVRLTLRVEDDGIGIPENAEAASGVGIDIMRYRSRMIGSDLHIGRRSPSGTVVECVVPVPDRRRLGLSRWRLAACT